MNTEKQTSKREYSFVTNAVAADAFTGSVSIVDKNKNELRKFEVSKLPDAILAVLVVHGLKQKLTDDTMVSKIGEDGDRLLALDALWTQLSSGMWDKEREGVARPPEVAIRLVMQLKKVERAVSEASLKAAGKEKWEAILAAHKETAENIAAKIKEEKAKGQDLSLDDLA